jgi:glycosyltransferase involved in cell wall biosynthesis
MEVLIVDDGSTDNSVEIIRELAEQYSCIRLLRNKSNQGVIYSANRGATLAKGNYLYFASANDLVLPGFFKKSMALLARYPDAGLCCSDSKTICAADSTVTEHCVGWLATPGYLSPEELANITHASHPLCLGGTNSILRRDVLGQDVFLSELGPFCDWFLCQVLVFRHGCCYIPEVLTVINSAADSHSGNLQRNHKLYNETCIKLFQLLGSLEYEDIIPFVIHSRSLYTVNTSSKSPFTVFNALRKLKVRNQHVHSLFRHMTAHYFLTVTHVDQILAVLQIIKSAIQRALQPFKDVTVTIFCFVQNLCDQAYAYTFHEYDKARTTLHRKLGAHNK